jgi:hypothetical protein
MKVQRIKNLFLPFIKSPQTLSYTHFERYMNGFMGLKQ